MTKQEFTELFEVVQQHHEQSRELGEMLHKTLLNGHSVVCFGSKLQEAYIKLLAGKEAERAVYAANKLTGMGFVVTWDSSHKCLEFRYKDARVRFYPYKGWFTGKTVKDGRGLQNLIKQLQV